MKLTQIDAGLSVIDFYATWCGPCKVLAPQYEELSKKYPHIHFYKCDVDKAPEFAEEQEISAMPTIIFYKNRKEWRRVTGADIKEIILNLNEFDKPEKEVRAAPKGTLY